MKKFIEEVCLSKKIKLCEIALIVFQGWVVKLAKVGKALYLISVGM